MKLSSSASFFRESRSLNELSMPNFFLIRFFNSFCSFSYDNFIATMQKALKPRWHADKGIFKPCVTHCSPTFGTGSLTKRLEKRQKDRPPCQVIPGQCFIAFINGDSCPWERLLLYDTGIPNMILSPK